ncbi:metallophosphoesterase domain-containing protein 1 [Puma concolor]|uniref:Metallophosphoesterase domain-containing protein 1 n=1 Tax=Puma concolor TaxID=9696 RepID=A0A6P6I2P8_PUMCO|nr:metallophosphoesterase domain-containing protein 1 [Puma concolor]
MSPGPGHAELKAMAGKLDSVPIAGGEAYMAGDELDHQPALRTPTELEALRAAVLGTEAKQEATRTKAGKHDRFLIVSLGDAVLEKPAGGAARLEELGGSVCQEELRESSPSRSSFTSPPGYLQFPPSGTPIEPSPLPTFCTFFQAQSSCPLPGSRPPLPGFSVARSTDKSASTISLWSPGLGLGPVHPRGPGTELGAGPQVDPVPHDAPKPPGYTRFVCVSDTHSRTDPIQMPYGDVLIHAGDFTELGLPSEVKKFNEWLGSLPYEYKIVIAGNHELTFDQEFMADLIKQDFYYFPSVSKLKPENYENVQSLLTNCIYLQDSEVTVRGFRIYGSPWQPWFYGWGFNLPRGQALLEKWNLIPEGVDILITHGPPLGYGVMADGTTTYVNASVCTVNYQPVNPPIVIDLPTPRNS